MARKYFRLPDVPPFTQVRIDTDPNVDSPADIRTVDGLRVIPDSLLRADRTGDMPDVYGPDNVNRLYLKAVSENVELDAGQADVPDLGASQTTGSLAGAAGPGLAYDDGQLLVAISADAGNSVELGTDHGLYVPAVVVDSNGNTVGTQGPVGPTGPQGLKGDKGDKGDPGVAGAAGTAGAVGPQGLIGATGPAGAAGPQGAKGDTGLTGPAGANGAQGPQGLAGVDGTVGTQGPQGIQGLTGATGLTGPIGPQGIQGLTGATGAVGLAGATGVAGPQGIQGIKGDAGDVGPVGPTGAKGDKGDAGATGPAGTSADVLTTVTAALGQSLKYASSKYDIALSADSGNAAAIGTDGGLLVPASGAGVGATGATGAKGDKGDPGDVGPAGPAGAKGDKGDPGNDGAPGATGPAGTAGATGPTGPAGTTGATGLQGTQGDPGPAGATGPTGPQGSQGIKGDAGDPGPAGATGPQGSVGATGAKGDPGDPGPKGDTGTQGIQGLTGATGPVGAQGIKGDTGAAGPAGATGPQGIQGLTGATGAAGPAGSTGPAGANGTAGATGPQGGVGATGPTGAPGAAATIGIGSVNTLTPGSSATVTNAGTSAAAVFNFGLPQGPTGATGPQGGVGAMGPAGPIGPQGPAGQGGITTAGTGINITGTGAAGSPYVVSATGAGSGGSSTYLTAGLNATVTGTGTQVDPFVVNGTKVIQGTYITVTGNGTQASPYVINTTAPRGYVSAGNNISVTGFGTSIQPYQISATIPPASNSGLAGSFRVGSLFSSTSDGVTHSGGSTAYELLSFTLTLTAGRTYEARHGALLSDLKTANASGGINYSLYLNPGSTGATYGTLVDFVQGVAIVNPGLSLRSASPTFTVTTSGTYTLTSTASSVSSTWTDGAYKFINVYDVTDTTGAAAIVTAGTNTTVTGSGTSASPYVVNAAGGVVSAGTNTTVTGAGTSASPYVVNANPSGAYGIVTGGVGTAVVNGKLDTVVAGPGIAVTNPADTEAWVAGNGLAINGTTPQIDGSETIVTAGAGAVVTGTGAPASPYVVSVALPSGTSSLTLPNETGAFYYRPTASACVNTNFNAGYTYFAPFAVAKAATLTSVTWYQAGATTGTSALRLYTYNATSGVMTQVRDLGVSLAAPAAAGFNSLTGFSAPLAAGVNYWVGFSPSITATLYGVTPSAAAFAPMNAAQFTAAQAQPTLPFLASGFAIASTMGTSMGSLTPASYAPAFIYGITT